jgi:DNA transformation protein and related proteins
MATRSHPGKPKQSELSGLRNIGKVTEKWLNGIGVYDEGELRKMGAATAYRKIRETESGAGLNLLYALHGALTDTHWNHLAGPIKDLLRREAERLEAEGRRR